MIYLEYKYELTTWMFHQEPAVGQLSYGRGETLYPPQRHVCQGHKTQQINNKKKKKSKQAKHNAILVYYIAKTLQ